MAINSNLLDLQRLLAFIRVLREQYKSFHTYPCLWLMFVVATAVDFHLVWLGHLFSLWWEWICLSMSWWQSDCPWLVSSSAAKPVIWHIQNSQCIFTWKWYLGAPCPPQLCFLAQGESQVQQLHHWRRLSSSWASSLLPSTLWSLKAASSSYQTADCKSCSHQSTTENSTCQSCLCLPSAGHTVSVQSCVFAVTVSFTWTGWVRYSKWVILYCSRCCISYIVFSRRESLY